jgi:excisionase family DNA binding protein
MWWLTSGSAALLSEVHPRQAGLTGGRMLFSVREAAEQLGVSRAYMYQLLRPTGPVPWVRLGRLRKIRPEALEEYVAGLGSEPVPAPGRARRRRAAS